MALIKIADCVVVEFRKQLADDGSVSVDSVIAIHADAALSSGLESAPRVRLLNLSDDHALMIGQSVRLSVETIEAAAASATPSTSRATQILTDGTNAAPAPTA